MKNNKFLVIYLKDDGTEDKREEFVSFRHIAVDLDLDYHVVRELHRISENKIQKKFLHDNLKALSKKIVIKTLFKDFKLKTNI